MVFKTVALLLLLINWCWAEKTIYPRLSRIVKTKEGHVKGYKHQINNIDRHIYAFLGIPFAQPPLGELRFVAPRPAKYRNEVLDARIKAHPCISMLDLTYGNFSGSDMWNDHRPMKEDCLQLNIWTPNDAFERNPLKKKAVMVWIYGGGFFSGSPSLELYDGSVLSALGDVIVVNINYRLGPFGFLSFGEDSSVQGNAGLLDQQLALKWIKENVEQFGGDKDRITLFGESAGAASVSAHMISDGSKDLFSGAILQSGTITNKWALQEPNRALHRSKALAKKLGCANSDREYMILCLKNANPVKIQNASENMWTSEYVRFMEFPFVPVNSDRAFFNGKNAKTAFMESKNAKIPVMGGIMKDEGSFWLSYFLPTVFNYTQKTLEGNGFKDKNITGKQFDMCLREAFTQYYNRASVMVNAIGYQYTSNMSIVTGVNASYKLRDSVNQFVGDFCFSCDLLNLLEQLAVEGNSPIFGYYFTERPSSNNWPNWMGAMHGYEIEYIFGGPFGENADKYDPDKLDQERVFSQNIITLWTHFAKYGSVPKETPWSPVGSPITALYELSTTSNDMLKNPKKQTCAFWRSLNHVYSYGASMLVNSSARVQSSKWPISLLCTVYVLCFVFSALR